jgi:hypothetical protein
MDKELLADLEYRIKNLRAEIDNYLDDESDSCSGWDDGYNEGRLIALQSELRFLRQMVDKYQ